MAITPPEGSVFLYPVSTFPPDTTNMLMGLASRLGLVAIYWLPSHSVMRPFVVELLSVALTCQSPSALTWSVPSMVFTPVPIGLSAQLLMSDGAMRETLLARGPINVRMPTPKSPIVVSSAIAGMNKRIIRAEARQGG